MENQIEGHTDRGLTCPVIGFYESFSMFDNDVSNLEPATTGKEKSFYTLHIYKPLHFVNVTRISTTRLQAFQFEINLNLNLNKRNLNLDLKYSHCLSLHPILKSLLNI